MADYYKLNTEREPRPCSLEEWASNRIGPDHHLLKDEREGELVSTVFLGIEHFGGMFETMHFPSNDQTRCHTYDEAMVQHQTMVTRHFEDVN